MTRCHPISPIDLYQFAIHILSFCLFTIPLSQSLTVVCLYRIFDAGYLILIIGYIQKSERTLKRVNVFRTAEMPLYPSVGTTLRRVRDINRWTLAEVQIIPIPFERVQMCRYKPTGCTTTTTERMDASRRWRNYVMRLLITITDSNRLLRRKSLWNRVHRHSLKSATPEQRVSLMLSIEHRKESGNLTNLTMNNDFVFFSFLLREQIVIVIHELPIRLCRSNLTQFVLRDLRTVGHSPMRSLYPSYIVAVAFYILKYFCFVQWARGLASFLLSMILNVSIGDSEWTTSFAVSRFCWAISCVFTKTCTFFILFTNRAIPFLCDLSLDLFSVRFRKVDTAPFTVLFVRIFASNWKLVAPGWRFAFDSQ